jgi:twitching motility protein PilT
MPRIDAFLKVMQERGVSDLHLSAGCEPMVRINGVLERAKHRPLSEDELKLLLYELLTDAQIEHLEQMGEIDCAYTLGDVARFRVNIYKKHPGFAAAFRMIPKTIPTLDGLAFPPVLKRLLDKRSGLVLITGPTNSGKSTTLAAMVNHINETKNYHIVTLEDPLEFIHPNKNCLIDQRQIGEHSKTFANALRAALREDANVILVGEMRDLDTISLALTASEVGLLVLGTLHTKSAAQTISRIVDAFPVDQQPQVRLMLAEVLNGVCSQQLLRRADGQGRVAALEIMIGTHAVLHLIREGKAHQVNNVIMTSRKEGMQLLDQHLKEMVLDGTVELDEAMRFAFEPQALELQCRKSKNPAPTPVSTS